MGKPATEVGVNRCLVPLIVTESVSIALSWLILNTAKKIRPEVESKKIK